ncbi:type II secretion system F family protein [Nocardiopsis sp. FIRDI 009]|uniref:type II secretion system F family protein n=1 Tax=Nocardiopsis sp. FIRDI 009 TaxID=714197 RepID=UPI000E26A0F9|nr:type II secretion system F family protein [Nocardiopsis sp. FIRDI 009]
MTGVLVASLGGGAVGLGLVLLAPALTAVASRARSAPPVRRDMVARLTVAGAAGVATWALTGWPVAAVLAAAATWWLPGIMTPDRETTAEVERIEAVAGWTEQLRDLIAGSSGLRQAIWTSAPIAPAPIRPHVENLAQDLLDGADLDDALTAFADNVDNDTADLVATALSMAASRHAADLGALLGTLAEAAHDRASMLVRTNASRARTRTSVRIIIMTTLAMVVGMAVFNGAYFAPLGSASGQMVLAMVGALWAVALWWLVRMSAPPRTRRVLTAPTEGVGI